MTESGAAATYANELSILVITLIDEKLGYPSHTPYKLVKA